VVGDVAGFYTGPSMVDAMMRDDLHLKIDRAVLDEIQHFIYTQPIRLPSETTFLGKALATVIGLCLRLDPGMDLLKAAAPYVTVPPLEALYGRLMAGLATGADLAKGLVPAAQHLMAVAERLDDGSLEVELGQAVERRLVKAQQRQTRQIVRSVLVGAAAVVVAMGWRRRA
jgi:predicted unusual protein kinase regulating ubiquinone biosynthesis (AarF/ABC1/UbiB family)